MLGGGFLLIREMAPWAAAGNSVDMGIVEDVEDEVSGGLGG
jgi:hypothetical protein